MIFPSLTNSKMELDFGLSLKTELSSAPATAVLLGLDTAFADKAGAAGQAAVGFVAVVLGKFGCEAQAIDLG